MDIPLPDYPQPFGTRKFFISTHQGPTAYVQGGEVVTAAALGWSSLDGAVCLGASFNHNNTGNYVPVILTPTGQAPNVSNNNVQGNPPIGGGANNCSIKWNAANGTEAANNTNLSSEFVRVLYIGG